MKKRRLLLAAMVAVPALAAGGYALAEAGGTFEGSKPATARFHDTDAAKAAGYTVTVTDVAGKTCIDQPGTGGMGIHLLNPNLLDATVDSTAPEALVYAPADNGQLKLAALEYIVFKQAWDDAHGVNAPAPTLFGQPYLFNPAPNRFGIPAFYALHSWIWKPNPSGTFQPWNPRVTCP